MLKEAAGSFFLQFLKQNAGSLGSQLCLPVGNPVRALLRPVATKKELLNPFDIQALTQWRNRFVTAFLNEFMATEIQTADWLVNTVGPSDTRILFMLDDLQGQTMGYMGVAYIDWNASYGEADAIVRGKETLPGIMTIALKTLLTWVQSQLSLQKIGVRVRSDNSAVKFYANLGFIETKQVPLKCVEEPNKTVWVEDLTVDSSPVSLVYMELTRSK